MTRYYYIQSKRMTGSLTTTLIFRSMEITDLPVALRIERQSFATPWSKTTFRQALSEKHTHSHLLVAVLEETVVAYAHFILITGDVHITNFAVDLAYRRRGIGKALLKETLDRIKKMGGELVFLEVRVSNLAAQNLYRQFGFQIHSIRKKYYSDNGEDAYLLWIPELSN